MRFAPVSANETRVDVSLTYRPCRTGLADAFQALIGTSTTQRMRAELRQASRALGELTGPGPEDAASPELAAVPGEG